MELDESRRADISKQAASIRERFDAETLPYRDSDGELPDGLAAYLWGRAEGVVLEDSSADLELLPFGEWAEFWLSGGPEADDDDAAGAFLG